MEPCYLLRLHDSLLQDVLARVGLQSRCAAMCACRRLLKVASDHPPTEVDCSADGVHPEACRRYIERARGAVLSITTARHQQRTACDAASARRFSTGVRCSQVVPYTTGPGATRLAALLPNLRHLVLDEVTCCLGGMTDEFASAVAANCPQLATLEVAFTRYSLPSELFTDAGMMALAAGCPRLTSLSLTNCGAITNRSLYAVASHCRGLQALTLGGYHELISDHGTVVLFQACAALSRVRLSAKLRRVTDASGEALAVNAGPRLESVKLTRSMGDATLEALSKHCPNLRLADCFKSDPGAVSAAGVAALLSAAATAASQQARPTAATSTTTAFATAADAGAYGSSSGGGGHSLRVVLPYGMAAERVLALSPPGVAATGAEAWRAACGGGAVQVGSLCGGCDGEDGELPAPKRRAAAAGGGGTLAVAAA